MLLYTFSVTVAFMFFKIFEVATSGPGFTIDEEVEHLGEALKLPPQFEADRIRIEKTLPQVPINLNKYQ